MPLGPSSLQSAQALLNRVLPSNPLQVVMLSSGNIGLSFKEYDDLLAYVNELEVLLASKPSSQAHFLDTQPNYPWGFSLTPGEYDRTEAALNSRMAAVAPVAPVAQAAPSAPAVSFNSVALSSVPKPQLSVVGQPARFPYKQFYIKNLAGGPNNFFVHFLVSVTQLPGEKHEQLRTRGGIKIKRSPVEKKRYSVHAEGVVDRLNKKPQFTPQEKEGYSKPQSTTYIDLTNGIEPKLFSWGSVNALAEVAFMFSPEHVLINRLWIYMGATANDDYSFENKSDADQAYINWVMGPNKRLFKTPQELTHTLIARGQQKQLTEAVVRLSYQFDGCAIAISTTNIESRWLALGYAERLMQRLRYRESIYKRPFPEDYQVPIYYYLPGDRRHLMAYSAAERQSDLTEASRIFSNLNDRQSKIMAGNAEFLLCLDNVDEVLRTPGSYAGRLLMDEIIDGGRPHIVELLFMKASRAAQDALIVHLNNNRAYFGSTLKRWSEIRDKELSVVTVSETFRQMDAGDWDKALQLVTKSEYATVLYLAVQQKKDAHVVALLGRQDLQSDYCYQSKDGENVIHLAIKTANAALVQSFLKQPWVEQALLQKNKDGFMPMHLAAKQGQWDGLFDMIKAIPRPDVQALQLDAVLFFACRAGQEKIALAIIDVLKSNPILSSLWQDPDSGDTVLHFLASTNALKQFDELLKCCYPSFLGMQNKAGLTPLQLAMKHQHWTLLLTALKHYNDGGPVNYGLVPRNEWMPVIASASQVLCWAITNNDDITMNELLSMPNIQKGLRALYGCNSEIGGPFFAAVERNSLPILKQLLKQEWISEALYNGRNAFDLTAVYVAATQMKWDICLEIANSPLYKVHFEAHLGEILYRAMSDDRLDLVELLVNKCDKYLKKFIWTEPNHRDNIFQLAVLKNMNAFFPQLLKHYQDSEALFFDWNRDGKSTFFLAIELDHRELVDIIWNAMDNYTLVGRLSSEANGWESYSRTLYQAVIKKQDKIVQALLDLYNYDYLFNVHPLKNQENVFHLAVAGDNIELLKKLLKMPCAHILAVDGVNQAGLSALQMAMVQKKWEMVVAIAVRAAAKVSLDEVAYMLISEDRLDLLNQLPSHYLELPTAKQSMYKDPILGNTVFHLAVAIKNPQCLEILLEKRDDDGLLGDLLIEANGLTPIELALERGHWEHVIRLLKQINGKLERIGYSAGICRGHEYVEYYTRAFAKIYRQIFDKAVLDEHVEAMLCVLSCPRLAGMLFYPDLMHIVISWGSFELFKQVLQCPNFINSPLNNPDQNGLTPIDRLVRDQKWDWIVELSRIRPHVFNEIKHVPELLLEAVKSQSRAVADWILKCSLFDHMLSRDLKTGNTVFHYAVIQGDKALFQTLVGYSKGAGLCLTNNAGDTPIKMALDSKQWDIMECVLRDAPSDAWKDEGMRFFEEALNVRKKDIVHSFMDNYFIDRWAIQPLMQSQNPFFQFLGSLKALELYYDDLAIQFPTNNKIPTYIRLVKASLNSSLEFMLTDDVNDKQLAAARFKQYMQDMMNDLDPHSSDLPRQWIKNIMNMLIKVLLYASIIGIGYMRRYEANHNKPYRFFETPGEGLKTSVEQHYNALNLQP